MPAATVPFQPRRLTRVGQLSERIALRAWTDQPNAQWGVDPVYGEPLKIWAHHEPVHGLEIRAGVQTGNVPTDLFWVHRTPDTEPQDISRGYVIEYDGRRYRIIDAIDVDGLHRFTRISALELREAG